MHNFLCDEILRGLAKIKFKTNKQTCRKYSWVKNYYPDFAKGKNDY